MAKEIMVFDKYNKQEDYKYMAKGIEDGKYHIGYIVIDEPWYSNENMWTYYIVNNKYGSGGMCGGATDLGLQKFVIDKSTIEPYTQIAKIKFNQSIGVDSLLVSKFSINSEDDEKNKITLIKSTDKIPYDIWNRSRGFRYE